MSAYTFNEENILIAPFGYNIVEDKICVRFVHK